jgi:hypothetical protein
VIYGNYRASFCCDACDEMLFVESQQSMEGARRVARKMGWGLSRHKLEGNFCRCPVHRKRKLGPKKLKEGQCLDTAD